MIGTSRAAVLGWGRHWITPSSWSKPRSIGRLRSRRARQHGVNREIEQQAIKRQVRLGRGERDRMQSLSAKAISKECG